MEILTFYYYKKNSSKTFYFAYFYNFHANR